jgi:RNA polymerase sigma-54 factor
LSQGFAPSQRLEQKVGLRVDPKVVLASQVLQCNQHELEQAIQAELEENPALERLQDDVDPITDETVLRIVAPQELRPSSEDFEFRKSLPNDDSIADWVDLAASETTLEEHLRAQLLPMLKADQRFLGEYLIASINEKGYLEIPIEEVALATEVSLEEAEAVLKVLQGCEPAGIGARDVQECLLLQLRDADTLEKRLARKIVRSHMDDFLSRRMRPLMRKFKVMPEVLELAFEEIVSLNPFPGEGFDSSHSSLITRAAASIVPDLILSRSEFGWEIEVTGPDANSLAIERSYRKRYQEIQSGGRTQKDETAHVKGYVSRASNFIQSVNQRRKTLRRIGEYLVQRQTSFVSTGSYEFLLALTRSQMARDLGMHESTVSRATMGKFVRIAAGEVVPFDVFFKPALRIQKMIEEILERENPVSPLSDERIAQILAERGVLVARRTVNKYRDRTKLLSSRARKSA